MTPERAARSVRRVAVSGAGAVSGLGWGIEALWEGLRSGQTAIRPFHRFDHSLHRTHLAAEVEDPRPSVPSLPPSGLRASSRSPFGRGRAAARRRQRQDGLPGRLSVADRFALFAVEEAVRQAGLAVPLDDLEAGVWFGSSTGGMWESEAFFHRYVTDRRRSRLGDLAAQQVNAPGDAVARRLGVTGPVQTISSACSSGALALGAALDAVRSGTVDVAVAGGSDSLCQLTYAGFNALRSVDEVPCLPFRAARAGMSFGEGAAVLVLEPLERVLARGASPLAILAGAGSACDAHHMTAPDPSGIGAAAALHAALRDAGLSPDAIDFVNAHATGTPLNDAAEWEALRRVFGERAGSIPIVLTKAMLGHLLGTAGAIEALVTVLCLSRGELHPAPGETRENIDLPASLVLGRPLPLPEARAAVSTSLAFGGSNAALVFSRWAGGGMGATA